jgi:hypothetical protein
MTTEAIDLAMLTDVRNLVYLSSEKEISHGRVPWQTRCVRYAMGPLASSIG